jgi:hypothetical protein
MADEISGLCDPTWLSCASRPSRLGLHELGTAHNCGEFLAEKRNLGFEGRRPLPFWGRRIAYGADPMMIGRYAIESTKPKVFEEAVNFKVPSKAAMRA